MKVIVPHLLAKMVGLVGSLGVVSYVIVKMVGVVVTVHRVSNFIHIVGSKSFKCVNLISALNI